MAQRHSIVAFQNTSVLIVCQEGENKISKFFLQKNVHSDKISTYGFFSYGGTQYFYTGSFDKAIKFWVLEGDNLQLVNSSILPKKITHSFYSSQINTHFVTDKYGDIYSFHIDSILKKDGDLYAEYQNSNNLAIQQAFKDVTVNENTSYCILGDSYSKIKLFDLRNMHDLANLWVPFESHLISILEFQEVVVFLFQMKDSETLAKRYAIHLVCKSRFSESDYSGEKIESIQFSENATKVRIEKKNDHQFVIYQITKESDISVQTFDIQQKARVSEAKGKLNFAIQQGQSLFLHLAQLRNNAIAVCGIKSNTAEDIQLNQVSNSEVTSQIQITAIHSQSDIIVTL
ncbi:hypothetical protein ABPG72_021868 [Tetrahymena utriculariae]